MATRRGAAVLIVIGGLSLAAMNVLEPRTSIDNRDTAPLLGPIYAAPVEEVQTHALRRGETLSGVLARMSIAGGELHQLLGAVRERSNMRSMNEGTEITVRRWSGNNEARAVEVRLNADSTLRVTRVSMGWSTDVIITPTVVDTVFVAGQIDAGRSLYESIAYDSTLNLPAAERIRLVAELASIYEYKLDFAHEIQPGDRFALAYEREARPDGTARSRRILVSRIDNQGKRFDAIYFKHKDIQGYYDLEGASLKRGFKRYPVDYVRITSSFAPNRYHPILKVNRAHLGTDFGAPTGTKVKATGEGTIVTAGRSGGYGNLVEIRHINGYTTRYAHLSRFGPGIRAGKRVQADDVIGYVGATGLATAPHLHYELRQNGKPIDSRSAKLPGAPPMPVAYQDDFRVLMRDRLALLENALSGARYARSTTTMPQNVSGGT